MTDKYILNDVPYHSQRDNKYDPSITCYPTSLSMVIAYILQLNNLDKTAIGCKQEQQLEDFLYKDIYSQETKDWMYETGFKSDLKPHTTAIIEEHIFNKHMKQYGYRCKFIQNATYDDYCFAIDKFQVPQLLHGKYPLKYKTLGHVVAGVGYNKLNKSFIINDPFGSWITQYQNVNGKEVEYPFGGIYIKQNNLMWMTSIIKL